MNAPHTLEAARARATDYAQAMRDHADSPTADTALAIAAIWEDCLVRARQDNRSDNLMRRVEFLAARDRWLRIAADLA